MNQDNGNSVATIDNPFASSPVAAAPTGASANALAQREVSEVQAAMIIAKRFPRDPVVAMDRILNACTRTGLAERAIYQYGRGGQDVTGPSIRLAEELARSWGNMLAGVTELSRSNGVSECLAYAWDLETNFRDEKRFQVRHWRDTKRGGYAITDERDIYELIANMGARRKRACILAIIPGDVQEAATRQCEVTLHTKAEITPDRIKTMLEKFEEYGVTKDMIEQRIQRRMDAITPALLVNLGKIYNSLRDGMSDAAEWFEKPQDEAAKTKADAVKDKLRSRKGEGGNGEQAPQQEAEQQPEQKEEKPKRQTRKAKDSEASEGTARFTADNDEVIDQQTGEVVPENFVQWFDDGTFSVLKGYFGNQPSQEGASQEEPGLFGAES